MTEAHRLRADILAIGSCVYDISCTFDPASDLKFPDRPAEGSSNPAKITQCIGGVAYNMALAAHYAGASVKLCTVVADDHVGDIVLRKIEDEGLSTDGIVKLSSSEGLCTGMHVGNYDASKRLLFGMADVSIMEDPSNNDRERWLSLMKRTAPRWILLDTCFSPEVCSTIIECARQVKARVFVETVSVPRAPRILVQWFSGSLPLYPNHVLDVVSPNVTELDALYEGASSKKLFDSDEYKHLSRQLKGSNARHILSHLSYSKEQWKVIETAVALLPFIPTVLTTLEHDGCILAMLIPHGDQRLSKPAYKPYLIQGSSTSPAVIFVKLYPPKVIISEEDVVSVNGAGDTFKGALLARIVCSGSCGQETAFESESHIEFAQAAAACSVKHVNAVNPDIRKIV